MKIDDALKKTAGLTVGNSKPSGTSKGAEKVSSGATGGTSSVNVQISSEMQALSGQIASSGAFDAGKVEEIKAAIASGQFQVNAEKVADGLMDTVRDLIQSRKA